LVYWCMSMSLKEPYSYDDAHLEQGEAMRVRFCSLPFPSSNEVTGVSIYDVQTLLGFGGTYVLMTTKDDTEEITEYRYDVSNLFRGGSLHALPVANVTLLDCAYPSSPVLINGSLARYVVEEEDNSYGFGDGCFRCVVTQDMVKPLSRPKVRSGYSTQFISDDREMVPLPRGLTMRITKYMYHPIACALEEECVFIPREKGYLQATGACLYNPETDVWTEDGEPCPDFGNSYAHTVVDDTLYVFSDHNDEGIWTYTLKEGWIDEGYLHENVAGVSFAQTLGRLILLGCDSGIYLYDTISGDWSRIEENPDPEPTSNSNSVVGACITDNTMLCLNAQPLVDTEERQLRASVVTINESLLYPSSEMGWGRLLEWDEDWRVTLGLDMGTESHTAIEGDMSDSESDSQETDVLTDTESDTSDQDTDTDISDTDSYV
ncbi:hypothetical protein KIPB_011932, partial [Kipferlia bialata]